MKLFAGASLKEAGSYMKVAALVGLLKVQSQNGLNLVSAPACAKQVGLEVITYTTVILQLSSNVTLAKAGKDYGYVSYEHAQL